MSLHDRLEADLRAAMKARQRERTSALRMAVAAVKNRAVADGLGPQGHLDDETVTAVPTTEVKRRREAAAAYRDADRDEQADAEEAEAEVYAGYLPEPLTDDELDELVEEVITDLGASGPSDLGAVMKTLMPQVQGRADGSRVSAVAKQRLTSGA